MRSSYGRNETVNSDTLICQLQLHASAIHTSSYGFGVFMLSGVHVTTLFPFPLLHITSHPASTASTALRPSLSPPLQKQLRITHTYLGLSHLHLKRATSSFCTSAHAAFACSFDSAELSGMRKALSRPALLHISRALYHSSSFTDATLQ